MPGRDMDVDVFSSGVSMRSNLFRSLIEQLKDSFEIGDGGGNDIAMTAARYSIEYTSPHRQLGAGHLNCCSP